jgi:hypothetical protein
MRWMFGAVVVAATVAIASGNTALEEPQNTLTPIDTVPTRQQLDFAFKNSADTPLENLSTLATEVGANVGVRLRAIHALAKYCSASPCTASDAAHAPLVTVIDANAHESTGSQVLLLRAAIETMGAMRIETDADYLLRQSLLDHPSRDVRAATARAFQEICSSNPAVSNSLRFRYSHELTEQVKLAISEALRILGQCTSNP